MTTFKTTVLLSLAALAAVFAIACGGSSPPASDPSGMSASPDAGDTSDAGPATRASGGSAG